jgi:flagellar biosynthesis regulator FlbT
MTESESALLALSELLSKMLRINPLERVEATEMLQNAVLKAVPATANDNVVEEMKTLKRAAAQTQQQMYHRWLEVIRAFTLKLSRRHRDPVKPPATHGTACPLKSLSDDLHRNK